VDCGPDDEEIWEAVNPGSWVTVPELRRQRRSPSMSAATFKRRHLNAWVAPEAERWIPGDTWNALAVPSSRIEPGATIVLGFDGSRAYDTSALAWASRADDGRIDVGARVFSVRADVPHHVLHRGRIDYEDIRDSVLELAEGFEVAELAFDPRFADGTMDVVADRLGDSAVFPIEPHSRLHREALAAFERQVLEGVIRHAGDPVIGEQLARTAVDRYELGDPRRLRKLERSRPIDVSVGLALAVWRVSLGFFE
jgi:phage terminase large subunit-like protein